MTFLYAITNQYKQQTLRSSLTRLFPGARLMLFLPFSEPQFYRPFPGAGFSVTRAASVLDHRSSFASLFASCS